MRKCLPFVLVFIATQAAAAGSEIANRNLGVNAKQVARVQTQLSAPPGSEAKAKPVSSERTAPTSAGDIRIERIEAYASSVEELEGPTKPPIQKFGERLAAERPMTPAEKAQMIVGFFLGGPPGKDPTPEERTQDRVARGGTMLATPRGAVQ